MRNNWDVVAQLLRWLVQVVEFPVSAEVEDLEEAPDSRTVEVAETGVGIAEAGGGLGFGFGNTPSNSEGQAGCRRVDSKIETA